MANSPIRLESAGRSEVHGVAGEGKIVIPKDAGDGILVNTTTPSYGWRDIIGRVAPKASGAGSPTRTLYSTNLYQWAFIANDVVDMEFHSPHDLVIGAYQGTSAGQIDNIYFHVHWSHNGTAISGTLGFDVYHTFCAGHNVANFPSAKTQTISYDTVDVATTPQYRHRIEEVAITGATATSAVFDRSDIVVDGLWIIQLKLTSLPTVTAGSIFVHTCDLHYQSTNIGTAGKAPDFYA